MSRERPVTRCPECGGVYKMEYVGPQDDPHGHRNFPALHSFQFSSFPFLDMADLGK